MSNDIETLAALLSWQQGEVIVVFTVVVKALRQQPGFDDKLFISTIEGLISSPNTSEFSKTLFRSIIE